MYLVLIPHCMTEILAKECKSGKSTVLALGTVVHMNDEQLQFSDKVTHLGHTLSYNLYDRDDIVKATKDLTKKPIIF